VQHRHFGRSRYLGQDVRPKSEWHSSLFNRFFCDKRRKKLTTHVSFRLNNSTLKSSNGEFSVIACPMARSAPSVSGTRFNESLVNVVLRWSLDDNKQEERFNTNKETQPKREPASQTLNDKSSISQSIQRLAHFMALGPQNSSFLLGSNKFKSSLAIPKPQNVKTFPTMHPTHTTPQKIAMVNDESCISSAVSCQ
jgi:hypothetical protein